MDRVEVPNWNRLLQNIKREPQLNISFGCFKGPDRILTISFTRTLSSSDVVIFDFANGQSETFVLSLSGHYQLQSKLQDGRYSLFWDVIKELISAIKAFDNRQQQKFKPKVNLTLPLPFGKNS